MNNATLIQTVTVSGMIHADGLTVTVDAEDYNAVHRYFPHATVSFEAVVISRYNGQLQTSDVVHFSGEMKDFPATIAPVCWSESRSACGL